MRVQTIRHGVSENLQQGQGGDQSNNKNNDQADVSANEIDSEGEPDEERQTVEKEPKEKVVILGDSIVSGLKKKDSKMPI